MEPMSSESFKSEKTPHFAISFQKSILLGGGVYCSANETLVCVKF